MDIHILAVALQQHNSTRLQRVRFFGDQLVRRECELTTGEFSIGEGKGTVCAGQRSRARGRIHAVLACPILLSPADEEINVSHVNGVNDVNVYGCLGREI